MLIPLSYICLWVKSLVPIYGSLSHSWYSWIPLSYICLWVKSLVPIYGSLSHGIYGCLFPSVIYAYASKAWYLSMVAEVMVFMDAYSPQLYMLMGQEPGAYLW